MTYIFESKYKIPCPSCHKRVDWTILGKQNYVLTLSEVCLIVENTFILKRYINSTSLFFKLKFGLVVIECAIFIFKFHNYKNRTSRS